jgi:hypothetical protein
MSAIRRRGPRRACPLALSAAAFAALIGCHTSPPRVTVPDRAPPPDARVADVHQGDASYDWHGLLVAPFGAVLKAVPMTLHEVLLFRDDARGSPGAENAAAVAPPECYATDAPAPRFFGRTPEEYLLCFTHDRLSRIQASVRLAAAQASAEFAAACAVWLKNAAAGVPRADAPGAGLPATESPSIASPNAAACEGRDGAVHFKGSLGEEPGPADMAETESVLSITLDSPPGP